MSLMKVELDNVKIAHSIFYHMLSNHMMFKENDDKELFYMYLKENEVRDILKHQAEGFECTTFEHNNVIYLVPNYDNHILGYTTAELKTEMCYSQALNTDYYLAQFVVLCLLVSFYDGEGGDVRTRGFIKFSELQNIVFNELKHGATMEENKDAEDDIDDSGIYFKELFDCYGSLLSEDEISRKRKTKEGFINKVIDFLESQGLVIYDKEEETISVTSKLDALIEHDMLNRQNYDRVLKVLGD